MWKTAYLNFQNSTGVADTGDQYKVRNIYMNFPEHKIEIVLPIWWIFPGYTVLLFCTSFLPLLCWCPFCIFERCLNSNPESCRTMRARYLLSNPSPSGYTYQPKRTTYGWGSTYNIAANLMSIFKLLKIKSKFQEFNYIILYSCLLYLRAHKLP